MLYITCMRLNFCQLYLKQVEKFHFMLLVGFRSILMFLCTCTLKPHDELWIPVSSLAMRNIWSLHSLSLIFRIQLITHIDIFWFKENIDFLSFTNYSISIDCSIDAQLIDFNISRPRQNGHHFPGDIFKCIFLNENVWIPIKTSLKFAPKCPVSNIPSLVKIKAPSHYLNQWGLDYRRTYASLSLNGLNHITRVSPPGISLNYSPVPMPNVNKWWYQDGYDMVCLHETNMHDINRQIYTNTK